MLLVFKPIKAGDFIEAQGFIGTVSEINITSTKLITLDNRVVFIPNGALSSGTINNFSVNELRRVDITVNIAYGNDIDKAKETALEIIKSIFRANNPEILVDGSLYGCGLDISNFLLMLAGIGILLFADLCRRRNIVVRDVILRQDGWFRWLFIALAVTAILTFGIWGPNYDAAGFIYFQF